MKKEKIKMFRDLLLCRKIAAEEKTASGLIIPHEARDEVRFLEVLEIGTGIADIKPGDKIVTIGQHPGGQDVDMNGEKLLVMREKYVFGVVEK